MAWVLMGRGGLVVKWNMYRWRKKKGHLDPIASNLPESAV
ncbi:protein of unknown function [Acidithiobacillus ferrivorans]|nr:protein of unknown function [Acidithiobacillus ferrivorans]